MPLFAYGFLLQHIKGCYCQQYVGKWLFFAGSNEFNWAGCVGWKQLASLWYISDAFNVAKWGGTGTNLARWLLAKDLPCSKIRIVILFVEESRTRRCRAKRKEMRILSASKAVWLCCPICKRKTRTKVREDTVLLHFPLYCPNCKQESMINVVQLKMTVDLWPNGKTCFFSEKEAGFLYSIIYIQLVD